MNQAQMERNVAGRKVAREGKVEGIIRSLVDARTLRFGCAGLLHEGLSESVLKYESKTVVRRRKKRSGIRCHTNK